MADRVAVLNKGRLEQFDTPKPSTTFLRPPSLLTLSGRRTLSPES